MRIVAGAVLAALLMTSQTRGSGERLAGEWVGGTDVLAGWRMAQLRFAADTGGTGWSGSIDLPSGDVMRLPLDGIRVESGKVGFRVRSPYGVYTFEGKLEEDRLVGEITSPFGRPSPVHVVRSRADLAQERAALAGAYSFPKGRRLLITPRPFGQLAAAVVDEARGGTRTERGLALIPVAAGRFVTSGSVVKALTADETIDFMPDDAGRVKAVRWLAPGEREIVAPRIPDKVEQEAVRFPSGPLVLDGTIWLPRGEGPFAAIVLVHGSGPVTRDTLFLRGRELARHGFTVLAYDKRGTGRGDVRWEHATFDDLADDALAAIEFLRHHPRVDPAWVGLQGSSQAGWIVPIAAARSTDVSFAIVVSGGGVTPAEQEIYRARTQTVRRGFAAAEADTAARGADSLAHAPRDVRGMPRPGADRCRIARRDAGSRAADIEGRVREPRRCPPRDEPGPTGGRRGSLVHDPLRRVRDGCQCFGSRAAARPASRSCGPAEPHPRVRSGQPAFPHGWAMARDHPPPRRPLRIQSSIAGLRPTSHPRHHHDERSGWQLVASQLSLLHS